MIEHDVLVEKAELYLKSQIASVSDSLEADFDSAMPFAELGIDSFYVLKVVKKLEDDFGRLPKTLLFENFNISDLANYFANKHRDRLRDVVNHESLILVNHDENNRVDSQLETSECEQTEQTVEKSLLAKTEKVRDKSTPVSSSYPVSSPIITSYQIALNDDKLSPLIYSLYQQYKNESSVSRGTRNIAPNLFIGSQKLGYLNYSRSNNIILVYSYTGKPEYFSEVAQEIITHCKQNQFQLNFLIDQRLQKVGELEFSATPFGAIQRVVNLQSFSLKGSKMRRLRYLVSKFEKAGRCETNEYQVGSNVQTDQQIVDVIDCWCEERSMVNPLVYKAREDILAGQLDKEHRVFITKVNQTLQNVILITAASQNNDNYLMDLEFYPKQMPLGGLEYAIVKIIETLVSEGCQTLSLGATFGPKLAESANADSQVDQLLDNLREKEIFSDEGNLQFKNKFRPVNDIIYLCHEKGSDTADSLIDIVMMIADPAKMQTSDETSYTIKQKSGIKPQINKAENNAEQKSFSDNSSLDRQLTDNRIPDELLTEELLTEELLTDNQSQSLNINRQSPAVIRGVESSYWKNLQSHYFNPLLIPSESIRIDVKTDSWAQLNLPAIEQHLTFLNTGLQQHADFNAVINQCFGFPHAILTESGRSAEALLYASLDRKGCILQNILFPTQLYYQIESGYTPLEMPDEQVFNLSGEKQEQTLFRGGIDLEKLQQALADNQSIALVCIEVSNNAAGGYPVEISHLEKIKLLLTQSSIPLALDITRIVENALFINTQQQAENTPNDIWHTIHQICQYADIITISLAKDFCINKGGVVAVRDQQLFHRLQTNSQRLGVGLNVIEKRQVTLALTLQQSIVKRVKLRMKNVATLWQQLNAHQIPVVSPAGGHCVLIDCKKISHFRLLKQPAASMIAWLYATTGIRATEHNVGMQKRTSLNELVRLAVPVGLSAETVMQMAKLIVTAFNGINQIPDLILQTKQTAANGDVENIYALSSPLISDAAYQSPILDNPDVERQTPSPDEGQLVYNINAEPISDVQQSNPSAQNDIPVKGDALSVQHDIATHSNAQSDKRLDIAIVGMAGRFPKANNVNALWQNLVAGKDCIEEIPDTRFAIRQANQFSKKYRGGFIDDIDKFDSLFFNISPREAEMLDPQERLFLEVAWEALEDAGYYPEILAAENKPRNIGVFVGAVWAMYQILGTEEKTLGNEVNPNSFFWSIANRVSYWMNLCGPSITLDTACSSSLTALYFACESLAQQECSGAIVGGVNLDLHQSKIDINSAGGALSKDGLCRSFGDGANGYVASEGVGAIYIKPLSQAKNDRDNIYGIIRGVTVNHGGKTSGYTVPSPKSQAALVQQALQRAACDARTIGYIEAHGTGTELGDPIEISGLCEAFNPYQVKAQSCAIGSIKSNIGHLEAAAGVVSVCKVLLQMKHRQLVPSLHSATLNEHIDFANSPFFVVQHNQPWEASSINGQRYPLRAGISSFGAGGANAHVIIEAHSSNRSQSDLVEGLLIFPLSARKLPQLKQMAKNLLNFLQQSESADSAAIQDVAFTLQFGRKSFEQRIAIIAQTQSELLSLLQCYVNDEKHARIILGQKDSAISFTKLLSRTERQQFIQILKQRRDPEQLAKTWTDGLINQWDELIEEPTGYRTSLPTYPFEDKRHWVNSLKNLNEKQTAKVAGLHPLIDQNESTFQQQIFSKTFTEQEFFIFDHLVSEIPTLPGVAYLELARKAGEMATGRCVKAIQNILWVSPLTVVNHQPTKARVELKPSGQSVQFEVYSESENGRKQLYSQGKLSFLGLEEAPEIPENIDLNAIIQRSQKVTDGAHSYPLFQTLGLGLGPSFQVVQEVYKNENEILGRLAIPEHRKRDFDEFMLHPSLVDGAFQVGMAAKLSEAQGEMFVPYSIKSVEVIHPLTENCYSYVSQAKEDSHAKSKLSKANVLIVDENGRVLVKITESIGIPLNEVHADKNDVKANQKISINNDESFQRLYYQPQWETTSENNKLLEMEQLVGKIILFDFSKDNSDKGGLSSSALSSGLIAEEMEQQFPNNQLILVSAGERFQQLSANEYCIDNQNRADFVQLLAEFERQQIVIENVVILGCSLTVSVQQSLPITDLLQSAYTHSVFPLLALTQSLAEQKLKNKVKLLYCFQPESESSENPLQAINLSVNYAINGFAKTLQLEHSKLVCHVLSLPATHSVAESCAVLYQELLTDFNKAQLIDYWNHTRQRQIIVNLPLEDIAKQQASPESQHMGLRHCATYLITGGLGGLGLIYARYLAEKYQANLILTGRSALDNKKQKQLDELNKLGGNVIYQAVDVSCVKQIQSLLDIIKEKFGQLNGIIHSAGVIRDAFLRNKTRQEMQDVFAPKVLGTVLLDELTQQEKLDFFVTFSSLAAIGGNAGQADYSYANAFMDAFMHQRNILVEQGKRSGKSLTFNWSIWQNGGMQLDEQTALFFKKNLGILPLADNTGLQALELALAQSTANQIAVVEGIQHKVEAAWGINQSSTKPYTQDKSDEGIAQIPGDLTAKSPADVSSAANVDQVEIKNTDNPNADSPHTVSQNAREINSATANESELAKRVYDELSMIVMDFLKIEVADISPDKILLDLGFDSIGLTTFANLINDKYELDITPVLFFEYPSLIEVAQNLASEHSEVITAYYGETLTPVNTNENLSDNHHATTAQEQGATASLQASDNDVMNSAPLDSQQNLFTQLKSWDPDAIAIEKQTGQNTSVVNGINNEHSLGNNSQQKNVTSLDEFAKHRFNHEPVAIVGMSGAMPQSENLAEFWDNLKNAINMVTVIPQERWNWEDYYGDPITEENKSNSKWGGFMKQVNQFDPLFFGISPREAELMDPQQRLFIQHVWAAIEDSGHKISDISGTRTGLFVGVATNDYVDLMSMHNIGIEAYTSTGNSHSVLVNRVSYLLNISGPSAPLDTACSSSLVAMHRALESIHCRSSEMAIVGGVQVMSSPSGFITFGKAGMLSNDGKCKTFDKRANGYVRGEGVGAVFLKPLSRAQKDGNHIYALVRATAENHGGRANALTAPNPNAQSQLLVEAYQKAGIDPSTIGYIECHGTGTSLGDPIEIQALKKTFNELYKLNQLPLPAKVHCALGSVKTNIGHLETAAGIAGILKVLLAIKYKTLPASLHFEEINPYIDLKGSPFFIVDKTQPWVAAKDANGQALPRIAGVSSFGFGGANAHVVLQEYLQPVAKTNDQNIIHEQQPKLVVLSARDENRLQDYVKLIRNYLSELLTANEIDSSQPSLNQIAFNLQVGRDAMACRLAVVSDSIEQLLKQLNEYIIHGEQADIITKDSVKYELVYSELAKQHDLEKINPTDLNTFWASRELEKIGAYWVAGNQVSWEAFYDSERPMRLSLPTYPFAQESYWLPIGNTATAQKKVGVSETQLHPLVHRNVSTLQEQKYASRLNGEEFFLDDHQAGQDKVLPGVAYLELARAAVSMAAQHPVKRLRKVVWMRPFIIENEPKELQIALLPNQNEIEFVAKSMQQGEEVVHCSGIACLVNDALTQTTLPLLEIQQRCQQKIFDGEALYQYLLSLGLKLGRGFQVAQNLFANEHEALAELRLPQHLLDEAQPYLLHPALMDGTFHSTIMGLLEASKNDIPLGVPFTVGDVQIYHPLTSHCFAYATWAIDQNNNDNNLLKLNFHILDSQGRILVKMHNFMAKPYQVSDKSRSLSQSVTANLSDSTNLSTANIPSNGGAIQPGLNQLIPVWHAKKLWHSKTSRALSSDSSLAQSEVILLGDDQHQLDWLMASQIQVTSVEFSANTISQTVMQLAQYSAVKSMVWIAPDVLPVNQNCDEPNSEIIQQQECGVIALFHLIKAMLTQCSTSFDFTLILSKTQPVFTDEKVQAAHASIIGFIGSIAKELPHWNFRLLDIESLDAVSAEHCLSVPFDKQGNILFYRQAQWFEQKLVKTFALPQQPVSYRQNGVYLVIGGAGGLGEVWSKHMIENYQAQIIWLGRRELSAEIQHKIDRLKAFGPAPVYYQVDALQSESLSAVKQTVLQQFSQIHGVVHSALVLHDKALNELDEAGFRLSLAAKVDISVNMVEAFATLDLDFMLFFSSIIAFFKTPRQSNYAAGCTFKDQLAAKLQQQVNYPVKVINWGFWGNVGVVADESYQQVMAQMGIGSIEPSEGMQVLDYLMNSPNHQLAVMKTLTTEATTEICGDETLQYLPESPKAIHPTIRISEVPDNTKIIEDTDLIEETGLTEELAQAKKKQQDFIQTTQSIAAQFDNGPLNQLLEELLVASVIQTSDWHKLQAAQSSAACRQCVTQADYVPWWLATLEFLQQQNWIDNSLQLIRQPRALESIWQAWEDYRKTQQANASRLAQLNLLQACLQALPDILQGKQVATDVMFPQSSMQLVEGIYRNNPVADLFNEVLAEQLITRIRLLVKQNPDAKIRILEIGAGTGGTTTKLLPLLKEITQISEYCYTDLSKAFLMLAESQFKPDFAPLTTAIFDVSKPLQPQGITIGAFDFVIATNVLHATQDIRQTLKNAKAALKTDGMILINEVSEWSLFGHLTFGLLDGWWLYDDAELRLAGSPGLAAAQWQKVLHQLGFEQIAFPAQFAHQLGQQIIIANSNGEVLQKIDWQNQVLQPVSNQVSPEILKSYVTQVVVDEMINALKIDVNLIQHDKPFMQYGVNSIIGVNIIKGIKDALTIELKTASLFEYNTLEKLINFIIDEWQSYLTDALANKKLKSGEQESAKASGQMSNAQMQSAKSNERTEKSTSQPSASKPTQRQSSDYIRQTIIDKLSTALKLSPDLIKDEISFADVGVDSIIGVDLVRSISEALAIELETTSLFEYSNVAQLSQYIQTNWGDSIKAPGDETGPQNSSANFSVEVSAKTSSEFQSDLLQLSLNETHQQDNSSDIYIANRLQSSGAQIHPQSIAVDRPKNYQSAAQQAAQQAVVQQAIAVIGMSCRVAESDDVDSFWQNISQGKNLVTSVTRWDAQDCIAASIERKNIDSLNEGVQSKIDYCAQGSFIRGIDLFDAAFFRIGEEEATYMDPQQRLFIQEAWRALENAGYVGEQNPYKNSCGVYVGATGSNYSQLFDQQPPAHAFWGNSSSVIPARVAYYLDLHGPAIAVDTACSSSLVAIHLACQALWTQEIKMAIAGGVSLHATTGFYHVANRAGMLSLSGACRSFDEQADGFVPGEGVGAVILKPLAQAQQDNDLIHGIIAASGINQDGNSNGLVAPNARAQELLENEVYQRFNINPATIQYIETHGTGTLLGDAIEFSALQRVFAKASTQKQYCALGTVKSNLGHTGPASGVVGLIKVLLSIKHQQMPANLHFRHANPSINFSNSSFYLNTQLTKWPANEQNLRRAAISSFGFSGTNAHLVVEQAPATQVTAVQLPAYWIVLSAQSLPSLQRQVKQLVNKLDEQVNSLSPEALQQQCALADLSYTLFNGRAHFTHRIACVVTDHHQLIELLSGWLNAQSNERLCYGCTENAPLNLQKSLAKFASYCLHQCQVQQSQFVQGEAIGFDEYFENLIALADIFVRGHPADYQGLFNYKANKLALPGYAFTENSYWVGKTTTQTDKQSMRIEQADSQQISKTDLQAVSQQPFKQPTDAAITEPFNQQWNQQQIIAYWLTQQIARLINRSYHQIANNLNYLELGVSSLGLANLIQKLNQTFSLDLQPSILFEQTTIEAFAQYLASEQPQIATQITQIAKREEVSNQSASNVSSNEKVSNNQESSDKPHVAENERVEYKQTAEEKQNAQEKQSALEKNLDTKELLAQLICDDETQLKDYQKLTF
ncbi:SDR family NAD(P)-dependent oxidoreductase [Aliikangiella maris]|uniref:SDR family NAD(P)-dependent oxidoreductase n=2 Tax=Aliikangiella maris TaxID=3162458 RepID=A0ABV3MTF8_9GAMM